MIDFGYSVLTPVRLACAITDLPATVESVDYTEEVLQW